MSLDAQRSSQVFRDTNSEVGTLSTGGNYYHPVTSDKCTCVSEANINMAK